MWSDYNHSTEVLLWELDKDKYRIKEHKDKKIKIKIKDKKYPPPFFFSVPRGDKLLKVQSLCFIVLHTVHRCFTQIYMNPGKQRLAIFLAFLISAFTHLTLQKNQKYHILP